MAILIDGTKGIFGVPAVYEKSVTSATAATGTVDFDVLNQSLLQYTTNASANWTINFRGNSSTTLNSLLPVGQSITAVFLAKQGTTPYYSAEIKIDGASIVPNWQGGSAPTAGTASGFDAYTYLIIKTGNANFSVYASLTNYASYVPPLADAYFNLTTLLLHGDGTNGAQNNTFLDSSTNNFTITRNGNTTQGTFTPFSQTGWGNYFRGNAAGDKIAVANAAAITIGTQAFWIEAFVYISAYSTGNVIAARRVSNNVGTGTWEFFIDPNGSLVFQELQTPSTVITSSATAIPLNIWTHVAVSRDSSNAWRLYINGVSSGTTNPTNAFNLSTTNSLLVGYKDDANLNSFNGYISNLRFGVGSALYTGATAFTVPTAPLTAITNTSLLTCQSNRFIDNSSNAFAITVNGSPSVQAFSPFAPSAAYSAATVGGSAYFDGVGDYLVLGSNAALSPGTSDFTLECWYFAIGVNSNSSLWEGYSSGLSLSFNASGNLQVSQSNVASLITDTAVCPVNQWTHIVVARSGTTLSLFRNGVRVGTTTSSANFTASTNNYLMNNGSTIYTTGYVSSLRFVKGTAVYSPSSTTLTVPVSPLTAITNTSLLLNFTNGGIIDQTSKNVLETVGNAQISTSVKKYGTGSLAFDGASDSLFIPYAASIDLKSSYTIEAWIYPTTTSGWRPIFNIQAVNSGAFGSLSFAQNGSALVMEIRPTTGGSLTSVSGGTLSANTWQHVTVAVAAGSARLFVNGTQVGSTTAVPDYSFTPIGAAVGANANGYNLSTESFNGYIDDLRITKGYSRYTANFTPPTAAFSDQ